MSQVNMESALCRYLKDNHTRRTKAASSKILEAAFNIKGSEVRRIINSLRCTGFPVCSDSEGYYYAASQEEINATIAQLNGRITKIANARNGLLTATPNHAPFKVDVMVQLTIEGGI